jgi:hypothetical protein
LKRSILYVLIAMMLAFGAVFVACGGGGDNEKDNKEPTVAEQQQDGQDQQEDTPAAKATAEKKETPKSDSGGDSGGSIGDVPVYPGAKETTSGEWSGADAMIPAIGSDVDAGSYSTVQYAMYETSDGADKVFAWYKDKMSGWDDQGSFSGGSEGSVGGFGVWTKDGGKKAAWVSIGEDSGTTTLGIFFGSQ